jgi:hypothetical protein
MIVKMAFSQTFFLAEFLVKNPARHGCGSYHGSWFSTESDLYATVVLDHLTEFAVLAGQPPYSSRLYLPRIMKAH